MRFAGGRLLDAEACANTVATRVPANLELVKLVEEIPILPLSIGGLPRRIAVLVTANSVQVGIASGPGPGPMPPPPTNPGDQNFVGALAAVLDPSWANQQLTALIVRESDMSPGNGELLWEFLLDTLPTAGVPRPKNLVVLLAAAQVDFERHCRRGRGLRWALINGAVLRRRRWESTENDIAKIAAGTKPIVYATLRAVRATRPPGHPP